MPTARRIVIASVTVVAATALVAGGFWAIAVARRDATVPIAATPYVESARRIAAQNAGVIGVLPLRVDEVRCGALAGDLAFAFVNQLGRAFVIVDGGPPSEQLDPPETTIAVGPATAEEFAAFESAPCE